MGKIVTDRLLLAFQVGNAAAYRPLRLLTTLVIESVSLVSQTGNVTVRYGSTTFRRFQGLRGRELYVRAVQTGRAIPIMMQEFTANLKHSMRGVWRDAELVDPNTHNKLATYHSILHRPQANL